MNITEFVNWATLGTYAGCLAMVLILTQLTKAIPGISKIPTQLWAWLLAVVIHLSHLKSFGVPYLMPYVAADLNDYEDERDFLWRQPLRLLWKRPIYAKKNNRRKLRMKL